MVGMGSTDCDAFGPSGIDNIDWDLLGGFHDYISGSTSPGQLSQGGDRSGSSLRDVKAGDPSTCWVTLMSGEYEKLTHGVPHAIQIGSDRGRSVTDPAKNIDFHLFKSGQWKATQGSRYFTIRNNSPTHSVASYTLYHPDTREFLPERQLNPRGQKVVAINFDEGKILVNVKQGHQVIWLGPADAAGGIVERRAWLIRQT
ncbi:hypothetical protein PTTG_27841 [Puccinia triticina 1-1 BBBD Race 1]|uniref:Uncharacterized protein n=1 Tax=Puccinia triticina (isolate 1-1 / race 1 (BBBD)) TaxID=630390 RepID=A0A180GGZ7_PUCT1|nr:hypothetical protein PTTG_27841 [Puccinia triticina 1-1 BBBD Race 1]